MSKAEYMREYNKKHTKRISLNLSKTNDQDIIKAIESESNGNLQAGVKSLIRKGMEYQQAIFKQLPC